MGTQFFRVGTPLVLGRQFRKNLLFGWAHPLIGAIGNLFSALDQLDNLLAGRRYLTGRRITEADWRLFTTLIRFDPVYATHFKTDRRRIADYPNLGAYLRELYQVPGIAQTVDMDHIRQHYFQSHKHLNPAGIIPIGPAINLERPALREDVGLLAMEAVK